MSRSFLAVPAEDSESDGAVPVGEEGKKTQRRARTRTRRKKDKEIEHGWAFI